MADVRDLGLTTNQLIARIKAEVGLVVDRNTVTAWTRRQDHPLPVAYRGKPGQGHRYEWEVVHPWLQAEMERAAAQQPTGDIDNMDWFEARTVKERERAKQAQMDTLARGGELGSIHEMELEAEDLGRHAVQQLRQLGDRVAPLLIGMADEVAIAAAINREVEAVCNQIAEAGAVDEAGA